MTRTILITGVGKRIGFALANYFLAQGHHVIGTYRTHYDSIDELVSSGASMYACDLTCTNDIDELINCIIDKHTSLDTIIHNASDWLPDNNGLTPTETMTRMMQIHVSAPYQINLALAPLLINTAKMASTAK